MGNDKWRNLFSTEEWTWCHQLSKAMHDAEEKKVFWEAVIGKKQADRNYSVFSDFPRETEKTICADILCFLKAGNEKRMREEKVFVEPEKSGELKELGELFSKLIQEGRHLNSDRESA